MSEENATPASPETPPAAPVNPTPVPVEDFVHPVDEVPATPASTDAPAEPAPKLDSDGNPIPPDRPEDYIGYQHPSGPNPNATAAEPVYFNKTDEQRTRFDDLFYVSAIPVGPAELNSLLTAYPSVAYDEGGSMGEWAAEVAGGAQIMPSGGFMDARAIEKGSHWIQRIPRGAGSGMGILSPNMHGTGTGSGARVNGDVAAMRAQQVLGIGEVRSFPLYHTGIWVTMKAPTAVALLELNRRIGSEKVKFGRMTDALAFSNKKVYRMMYLADFAIAHILSATTAYSDPLELKNIILSTDLPLLIWGMLCTMYPSGYSYHQPCMHDPSACNYVIKEYLDISKILFTDRNRLTEKQLLRLEQRHIRATAEQLADYQADHRFNENAVFDLPGANGKLKIALKVPTIAEYASEGLSWVDGLHDAIMRAFGSELSGERRNDYLLEAAQATDLREYAHWVKSIGYPDGTEAEAESNRKILDSISGTPGVSDVFFRKVKDYMEKCTISMVALPKMDCPECQKPMTPDEKKHPYLNPINVEELFFTILGQQVTKALIV